LESGEAAGVNNGGVDGNCDSDLLLLNDGKDLEGFSLSSNSLRKTFG
jgi:hypothetical protein